VSRWEEVVAVFILTWNPHLWAMSDEEYEEAVTTTAGGERKDDTWSMGSRRGGAVPGDLVFLLRQHTDRGIIGAGTIASEIYEDEHWNGKGGIASYVDVHFEHWLPLNSRLDIEDLLELVPEVPWNNLMGSGTMVSEDAAASLIAVWEEHLAEQLAASTSRGIRFRVLNDHDTELDADFLIRPLSPTTESLIIESRGGGRNRDYIEAFRTALGRAVDKGWNITDAFLASDTVQGLDSSGRRIDTSAFPQTRPGAAMADDLRRAAAKMHRRRGAKGPGNATKRIEVVLQHQDASRLLSEDIRWSVTVPALPKWANEEVIVRMKIGEAAAADPTMRTEGLQRHARTQNVLLKAVLAVGGIPKSLKVNADLVWRMPGDPLLYVAEVKGVTAYNQAGQMRLGLGQVTDFVVEATHETGLTTEAILFLSGPPTLPRWMNKAERASVELAWVGKLPAVVNALDVG
jgi:hypothetical protein